MKKILVFIFSLKIVFIKKNNRVGFNPFLYTIDKHESVDIDEMEDFIFAEYLMKKEINA